MDLTVRGLARCRAPGLANKPDQLCLLEWDDSGQMVSHEPNDTLPSGFLDCDGLAFLPAYVDQHVHGYGPTGSSTMDELKTFVSALARVGTAAACISTVAMRPEQLIATLALISKLKYSGEQEPCRVLGAHIEGAFIGTAYARAHDPRYITPLTVPAATSLLRAAPTGTISNVTVSPDGLDADAAIETLTDAGVVVSLGHTGCSYEQALRAVDAGATCVTHMFNAMRPTTAREPSLLGLASDERVSFEVIPNHGLVHPANLALLLRAVGPERVIAVSDCVPAVPASDHATPASAIERDGVLQGGGVLLPDLTPNLRRPLNGSLIDLVRLTSQNSLALLGIKPTWPVTPGQTVVGVLLDDQWRRKGVVNSVSLSRSGAHT